MVAVPYSCIAALYMSGHYHDATRGDRCNKSFAVESVLRVTVAYITDGFCWLTKRRCNYLDVQWTYKWATCTKGETKLAGFLFLVIRIIM